MFGSQEGGKKATMKMLKNKKGFNVADVPQLAILLVVIAVVLGVGMTVLAQVKDTQTTSSLAYNVTGAGEEAVEDLSDWQTTWAVIIAAAVVIGIISRYLFFGKRN